MNKEILTVVDVVSNEKGVGKEIIFDALEAALGSATKKRFEADVDCRVSIDRATGDYQAFRRWEVIDPAQRPPLDEHDEAYAEAVAAEEKIADGELPYPERQIWLTDATAQNPALKGGDFIEEPLEAAEFGRIAAQTAKQVIVQKVREAERAQVVDAYKDRVGELVMGIVKRVDRGNVYIDLGGNAEAVITKDQLIPRELVRSGDRIRGYLFDVRPEKRGPQLFVSRTAKELLIELFKLEVPEIGEGVIEVLHAARDPGLRAKIAVRSRDQRIDPIGACVGMRGSRVQAVVAELQGEKIDIIQWNSDEPTFIVNALAPAEVSKVVLDEEADRVEVVVPDEQLSLAIGRRGQNVRLASQLTGWQIDIITESQDSERRQREFSERTALFQEALDVDEVIAQLLVTEGFATVEDLAFVESYEISDIEGFDEDTAEELQARARDFLDRQAAILDAKRIELGVLDEVMTVPGVTGAIAVALGEGGIKTVEDLADLATDEIRGGYEVKNGERTKVPGVLEAFNLAQEEAEMLILQARVAAGWIDASELPQPPEPEYEEELAEGEYDAEAVFAAAPEGDEGEAVEDEVLAGDPEQPENA